MDTLTMAKPAIAAVNDFVVKFANVNGSGSASANEMFARAIMRMGVPDKLFENVTVFPLRVKSGDEASCLNLNRAQQPRILGAGKNFIARGGFSFAAALDKTALKG